MSLKAIATPTIHGAGMPKTQKRKLNYNYQVTVDWLNGVTQSLECTAYKLEEGSYIFYVVDENDADYIHFTVVWTKNPKLGSIEIQTI
jgi:hypothetical protein